MLRAKYIAVPTFAVTHVHTNLATLDRLSADATSKFLYYSGDKVLLESQFTTNLASIKIDYNNLFSRVNVLDSRYFKLQNAHDALDLRVQNVEKYVKPEVFSGFTVATNSDGSKTLLWNSRDIFERTETTSRPYQIQSYALSKAFQTAMKKYMIEDGAGSTTSHSMENVTFANNAFTFKADLANAVLTSTRQYLKGGLDGNSSPTKYFIGLYPNNQYFTLSISFNGGSTWTPYSNETIVTAPAGANASIMLRVVLSKALFTASGIRNLYGFFILHD